MLSQGRSRPEEKPRRRDTSASHRRTNDSLQTHAYTQNERTNGHASTELDDAMFDRTTHVDATRTRSTTGSEDSDGSIWSLDTSSTQSSEDRLETVSSLTIPSRTSNNGVSQQPRLQSSHSVSPHPPNDAAVTVHTRSSSTQFSEGGRRHTAIHRDLGGILCQEDDPVDAVVSDGDWTASPPATPSAFPCAHARRRVVLVRHGETMACVFPDWVRRAFAGGVYQPYDLNQPLSVVRRPPADHAADSPLTQTGMLAAQMTGRGLTLLLCNYSPFRCSVYASPALSCVQTAHHILKSLKLPTDSSTRICVEPGLFNWLKWYDSPPTFLSPYEHKERMGIDRQYHAIVTEDELRRRFQRRCETFADCHKRIQRTVSRIVDGHNDHYNYISDTHEWADARTDRDNYVRSALLGYHGGTTHVPCGDARVRSAGQTNQSSRAELILIVGHALTIDAALSGLQPPTSNQHGQQPPTATTTDRLDRTYPFCTTVVLSDVDERRSADTPVSWVVNRRHALPPLTRLDADSYSDLNSFFLASR